MVSKNDAVEAWRDRVRQVLSVTLGGLKGRYKDYREEYILALIDIESDGNEKAWRDEKKTSKSQFVGLLQQGNGVAKDLGMENKRKKGRHKGGVPVPGREGDRWPLSYYLYGNGELAIKEFLRLQDRYNDTHKNDPITMAIIWKGGVGTAGRYQANKSRGMSSEEALRESVDYYTNIKGLGGLKSTIKYVADFVRLVPIYAKDSSALEILDFDPDAFQDTSSDISGSPESIGEFSPDEYDMTPFEFASYVSPEELRRGIVAQFFQLSKWHLAQIGNPENKNKALTGEDTPSSGENSSDAKEKTAEEISELANFAPKEVSVNADDIKHLRGDQLTDERNRYAASIVQGEFYRRRYASRQVPAVTGPFNPFPVAGFPGLIMRKKRPILGLVTNVNHNITVASGSANTSVSMAYPRYWNEGDPWYWMGGRESESSFRRRFPQWLNRYCMAQNSHEIQNGKLVNTFDNKPTKLGELYNFFLGCDAIEYKSNNKDKVGDDEKIRRAIADRDPGDLEVNPETLDILEYNELIAPLDASGKFVKGSLAEKFYGYVDPNGRDEPSVPMQTHIDYSRRYGVRERDLMENFLGNKIRFDANYDIFYIAGPTFITSPDETKKNSLQLEVIEYIQELRTRNLNGGV